MNKYTKARKRKAAIKRITNNVLVIAGAFVLGCALVISVIENLRYM